MPYTFDFPIKHLYPSHDTGIPVAVFITYGHEHTAFVFFAATPGHRRNLLGRQGWIRNFGIGLFDYNSTLYLRPIT